GAGGRDRVDFRDRQSVGEHLDLVERVTAAGETHLFARRRLRQAGGDGQQRRDLGVGGVLERGRGEGGGGGGLIVAAGPVRVDDHDQRRVRRKLAAAVQVVERRRSGRDRAVRSLRAAGSDADDGGDVEAEPVNRSQQDRVVVVRVRDPDPF